jgi:hypothetical protein
LDLRRIGIAVLVAVVALMTSSVALTSSSYGSVRHVAFSKFLDACALSVPVPRGFHEGVWSTTGGGGIKISNRAPGPSPESPNQVTLYVGHPGWTHGPITRLREFPSHVTLDDLQRASGGLTSWGGGFQVGADVCTIGIWLGPEAKAADRLAILSALEAIKKQSWVG